MTRHAFSLAMVADEYFCERGLARLKGSGFKKGGLFLDLVFYSPILNSRLYSCCFLLYQSLFGRDIDVAVTVCYVSKGTLKLIVSLHEPATTEKRCKDDMPCVHL